MYRKGQISMMEYILVTFFILMVIVGLLFFLSWYQFSQINMEEHKAKTERILFLAQYVSNSPYLVKENSVFDDSKLTALKSLGSSVCKDLEDVFGYNWYLKFYAFDADADVSCTWGNYPECNSWEFCTKDQRNMSRILPVNIYRKMSDENGIGTMEVGMYV